MSKTRIPRRNWSGSAHWDPHTVHAPRGEDEILAALRRIHGAGEHLRVVGGAHSFSALAAGDEHLMSLDNHQGLVRADSATGLVTLRGGTRLWRIADLLAPFGLALAVMGDIDHQSIAGAIQTGTHGTGAAFTGFAGAVRALRFALPDGTVVEASEEHEPELFQAARLGLGSIGVILEVTLQCVPSYCLSLEERTSPIDETVGGFLDDTNRIDHHEFFWFPSTRRATVRSSTRLPADARRRRRNPVAEVVQREALDNGAFEVLCRAAARAPRLSAPVADIASRFFAGPSMVDRSDRVFVAPRRVRFHESEWAIPAERFEEAFTALDRAFRADRVAVTFPLEFRRAAADDVWLSTAYGRDTVYIAAHRHHHERAEPYLQLVQRTLAPFAARPHWGKMHWLGEAQLRDLYPRFDDFRRVRAEADPAGTLLSPYLRHLLG